jgi:predicted AAA+ superfamily ATPase
MARITPKTNWQAGDSPLATDFNRIEENNAQSFVELDEVQTEDFTFSGVKTFVDDIKLDTIISKSGNGVTIDGVNLKNGIIYGVVWGS